MSRENEKTLIRIAVCDDNMRLCSDVYLIIERIPRNFMMWKYIILEKLLLKI